MVHEHGYEIGAIVQLKSGGPNMTVQTTSETRNGLYKCQWFAGKKLEFGHFPFDSLKAVTGEAE